jgi:hypothetical protein
VVIVVHQPACDRCPMCRSAMDKAGFVVEDDQHTRGFLCTGHLFELLRVMLMPVRTITSEA